MSRKLVTIAISAFLYSFRSQFSNESNQLVFLTLFIPYNDKKMFNILCKSGKQSSRDILDPANGTFRTKTIFCLPWHILDRFCFGLRLIQAQNKPAGYHSGSGTCRAKTISYLDISFHFFVRVISYHFSGHLVPPFILMGFNSLMLFFYVSKFTF